MKKLRRLNKEKLTSIVQTDYVVINIIDYNRMIYDNTNYVQRFNMMCNIIYDGNMSIRTKYNKIRDILQGKWC